MAGSLFYYCLSRSVTHSRTKRPKKPRNQKPKLVVNRISHLKTNRRKKPRIQEPKFVDRISSLPDHILCHILSFLPTKSALRTSILAKRWQLLWTMVMVDTLSLDCPRFSLYEQVIVSFNRFIRNLMDPRKPNMLLNTIKKLRFVWTDNFFYCSTNQETEMVDKLLTYVTVRGVQELDLHGNCADHTINSLPISIFTSETLEVLKLNGEILCPTSFYLPRLKTLHLVQICYRSKERVASMASLISECPMLESLFVHRNRYDSLLKLVVSSPVLRNLRIDFDEFDDGDNENVGETSLEINAPALEYLDLRDASTSCSIGNLSLLVEAKVDLIVQPAGFATLVQQLYRVKDLSLSAETVRALAKENLSVEFTNLTKLKLAGIHDNWDVLLKFLQLSNKLETLILEQDLREEDDYSEAHYYYPKVIEKAFPDFWDRLLKIVQCDEYTLTLEQDDIADHDTIWSRLEFVPLCVSSCLKTITIDGFKGLNDEFVMLKYVLENSKVLKTVKLHPCGDLYDHSCLPMLMRVSELSRAYQMCQIEFC